MSASSVIYLSSFVHSLSLDFLEVVDDGAIFVVDGIIKSAATTPSQVSVLLRDHPPPSTLVVDYRSKILIPGFIDTHIHAPQYIFAGFGNSLPLLQWLEKFTFPNEAKFSDLDLARFVYQSLVRRLLRNGTTTACYFATIHLEATKLLMQICEEQGQRALVGKVCMDQNSPQYYIDQSTEDSINETQAIIEHYMMNNRSGLILPIIVPRFAISCSLHLMSKLGELAKQYNTHIQSHISENIQEVEFVRQLHPDMSYTQVYDTCGLLTNRTVMAHGIYLSDDELSLFRKRGAAISHCPTSNFNLLSGLFNARRVLNANVKLGLGTDNAGGYSISMLQSIRDCLKMSMAIKFTTPPISLISEKTKTNVSPGSCRDQSLSNNHKQEDSLILTNDFEPLKFHEAFFLATLGGAQTLDMADKIGNFQVGKSFDAQLINLNSESSIDLFGFETIMEKFEKFLFLGDERNVEQVFIKGKPLL